MHLIIWKSTIQEINPMEPKDIRKIMIFMFHKVLMFNQNCLTHYWWSSRWTCRRVDLPWTTVLVSGGRLVPKALLVLHIALWHRGKYRLLQCCFLTITVWFVLQLDNKAFYRCRRLPACLSYFELGNTDLVIIRDTRTDSN